MTTQTLSRARLLRRVLPTPLVRRLPAGLVHEYIDPPEGTRLRQLTVMARVPDDAVPELQRALARLRGPASPFENVPGTHFARLAVVASDEVRPQLRPDRNRMGFGARLLDLITHHGRGQELDRPETSFLLFSADYDGIGGSAEADRADYAERLRTGLGERADQIWGQCEGYPGRSDAAAFAGFLDTYALRASYVFSATDAEPSVREIHDALNLRRRVAELAATTEHAPEAELAAWLRATWEKPAVPFHTDLDDLADLTPNDLSWPTAPIGVVRPGDRARLPAGSLPLRYPEPRTAPPVAADVEPAAGERLGGGPPPSDPDLTDVQNLVVSGYPRHQAARHLLLAVTDAPAARHWLAGLIDEIPTAGWAEHLVDRLGRDVEGADAGTPTARRPSSPTFAAHVAISYAGLTALGLPPAELSGFPAEFTAGLAAREAGLIPSIGTSTWQAPFRADGPVAHILLMVSAPDPATLDAELGQRPHVRPGETSGLRVLDTIEAGRIPEAPNPDGSRPKGFREHFGFVDGLSQPRVHGVTTGRHTAELPSGEALLGYRDIDGDTSGVGLPARIGRNGSYLVWRKLEQDVAGFEQLTRDLAENLAGRVPTGTDPRELAAAKLMGRWRDGTPLTLSTDGPRPALAREPFSFQAADAEGFGCPVGAHVRRANPRDSRPTDPEPDGMTGQEAELESTLALRHRMLRRGIPYGKPLSATDRADAGRERGLLFVALVGDIHRQFEFIQAHWLSDGNAFRLGSDSDVISGAAPAGCKFVAQGPRPAFVEQHRQIVTCRGGEYFLLPGIQALRHLSRG